MTSRKKGGLRGKVKKKIDYSDDQLLWPQLKQECKVDLERIRIQKEDHLYVNWMDDRAVIGQKRKQSAQDNFTVSKKMRTSTSVDGESVGPTIRPNSNAKKKTGVKDDQIFVDFELGKSRRISEINTLLRSSGKNKQFSSLPPNSLARAFLSYLNTECSGLRLTAIFLCAKSAEVFMALMERRGRKPETVFHAWTDLNSLVRRQLDPEDMKAVEMEANRLNILHSQVSNSGDEKEGSRTSRMKEIFEYKSLHLSTSPKSWSVPSGPSALVVLRVGRAEGEVLRLDLCSESLSWEEGLLPESDLPNPSLEEFNIKQLQPSGHWVLDIPEKEAKCCLTSKDVTFRLIQQLEEDKKKGAGGMILATLWEEDLAYLLQMASRHGGIARLRNVLSGVTSVEKVWKAVNQRELQPGDLSKNGAKPSAESGYELLKLILEEKADLATFCCPLDGLKINKLLCSAMHQHGMEEFSELVSTAVLVNPLAVEAGRMALVTLSVRPELRGHAGSQYNLSLLVSKHKQVFSFGTEVLSSSGQGRLMITLTNVQKKKVKMAAGSVFGLVRRIEDFDTELENEKLRDGEAPDSEEELVEEPMDCKAKDGDEESDVMISLDLLRETLTKELQARDSGEKPKPIAANEENLVVNDSVKEKHLENSVSANPPELNEFIDLDGSLGNKDILTELNDLQPSDLEISNWDDINSALEGIDMAADFDIVAFSENPLSTLPTVADLNAIQREQGMVDNALAAKSPSTFSRPLVSASPNANTEVALDITPSKKEKDPPEEKLASPPPSPPSYPPTKRRQLSRNQPLVVQLASIKADLNSSVVDDEEIEEQFPSVLGQQQFVPLLQTLVSYVQAPMPLDYELTDFGDKMILELQNLDFDNLEDLFGVIRQIHEQNLTASLSEWEKKFAEKFEHFLGINDMLGDGFDSKVIQLLLLHFADKLQLSSKLESSNLGLIGFVQEVEEMESSQIETIETSDSTINHEVPEAKPSNLTVQGAPQEKSELTPPEYEPPVEPTPAADQENPPQESAEQPGSVLDGIIPEAVVEPMEQTLDAMSQESSFSQDKSKDVKDQNASENEKAVAALNPRRDMDKIFLGVTDEFIGANCKIMALNGEDPFYATFSSRDLVVKGKKVDNGYSVKHVLAENGDDDDLILVRIAGDLSGDEDPVCNIAIPLSSWTDGVHFFDGLVLFRDLKDEVRVAFLHEGTLRTLQVTKDKIKMFDAVTDLKCLEPGLEVKLMVEKVDDRLEASICVPNPEKKFYDLLEISNWGPKTRRHMTDPDTQSDITESFKNQVTLQTVQEENRQFLLIRASTKKMATQVSKLVQSTKKTFEKIPGMKPKVDASLEVFMEFLPEGLQATEKFLEELIHVSHYTGTHVSLVDGEVLIEGLNYSMVVLARDLLNYNIGLAIQNPVLGTSSAVLELQKQSSMETTSATAPKRIESRVSSTGGEVALDDDAEVSSTTEGGDPQLDCNAGKEVGEGRLVEVREVPRDVEEGDREVPRSIEKCREVQTETKVMEVKELPRNATASSQAREDGMRDHFDIVLESDVIIKGKSVAFADAVVEEASDEILGQVHEIERHKEFTDSDIFVPERQKKRITDTGKLKVSLRNKTDDDKSLKKGMTVCLITVKQKSDKEESKSESTKAQAPSKENEHNTNTKTIEEVVLLSDSEDEDISILEETKGTSCKLTEGDSKKSECSANVSKTEEAILENTIEKKPKLPQIKTGAPKKTDPSERSAKVPCTHPHLETEACPNVLLSGAECKLVNCSASGLQHNFPEDFMDSLGQEFCLRHLRNRVCTRALPPFICSSRQHVESPGPVLAFYRSYRQKVYKNCANCCQKISEDLPIEQKKDPSKMEKKFNAQSTPTIYSKSAEEEGNAKAAVKDFCGHIKFRMNLCRFRDKVKCQRTGCTDVHAINEVLKIQFCKDYLEDPQACKKSSCAPHFDLDQLQERYHLAVRARVLNCSKCIFRCKHFNLANVAEKKPRPCADDFAGKCSQVKDGLVACAFVHREEVQHLDLPAPANLTLAEYEEVFFKSLAACKGFCKICRSEIEEMKKEFERKTKMEVFKPVGQALLAAPAESSSQRKEAAPVKNSTNQPSVASKQTGDQESRVGGRRCRIFWGSGFCRFGSNCRFSH